jgi:uncharacterized membrane protein
MKRFGAVAVPIAVGIIVSVLPGMIIGGGAGFANVILADLIEADMLPFVSLGFNLLSNLVGLLVGAYMAGGYYTIALKGARGQPSTFGDVFAGGRWFGKMLIATILFAILYVIGFVLCVVPGIIVGCGLAIFQPLIVDQDLSSVDALKRSWEMTKGNKMSIFLFFVIGFFVMLGGLLACLVGALLVSAPMLYIGIAYMYLRLKGENPPVPT